MSKRLLERTVMPFAPEGTNTFGLEVIKEDWDVGGTQKTFWKYGLPNMVQIVALTPDNHIIAISEFQPSVGADYLHVPGETFDEGETDPIAVAQRGLFEETGYKSNELAIVSTVLENSGRSDRLIFLVLARNCIKEKDEEKGIKARLFSPEGFWKEMMAWFFTKPETKHGGSNTLKALALAYQQLGWLKIELP